MKTPAWAKWVSIIMMVVGAFALYSDIESISPKNYDPEYVWENMTENEGIQDEYEKIEDEAERDSLNQSQFEDFKTMMTLSDYLVSWMVRFGYIGIAVNLLYILSGLNLFRRKKSAPKLVIAILIISMIHALSQTVVYKMDEATNFMSSAIAFTPLIGLLIDAILLVIVLNSDKEMYTES